MAMKGFIFASLFVGFLLLFRHIRWLDTARRLLQQTKGSMDEVTRQRMLQSRRALLTMQSEHSVWNRMEQELAYSGLKRRFGFLTAENWIVGNLMLVSLMCLLMQICGMGFRGGFAVTVVVLGVEKLVLMVLKTAESRRVEGNLLKFLDFLGNYSITAGEVTGVFWQVSRYVEEPLKNALEQCYFEAQTTGDAGLALLSMAEGVEHPLFKELVRNMEVSIRYSADFTALVNTSRRTVRDYLRSGTERKGMLREAGINLALLLGLSGFILLTVDGLIEVSIWQILFFTLPGRIGLGVLGVIFLLFARQIYRANG